jgi:hypothetical protein
VATGYFKGKQLKFERIVPPTEFIMPAVCTVPISKATRRASSPIATQTSAKRLRRASSPLLPQYIFPPSSEEEHLQRIEEEPDREVANERVCELQRLAGMSPSLKPVAYLTSVSAGSPTNHVKVQNYKNERKSSSSCSSRGMV